MRTDRHVHGTPIAVGVRENASVAEVEVTALAVNVEIPEHLRWTDTRRGEEFLLSTLNVRLLPDGRLAAKAYGRPTAGGRGTYTSFAVPDRPELRELIEAAADRAGQQWARPRGAGAALRRLHAALEAGAHGEELRELFTEDAVTVERPNVLKPAGAVTPLEKMLAASSAGAGLLERQRYDVAEVMERGDTVAVRLTWTGVIARDAGPLRAGQILTAHIAQFAVVRDGRIDSIETYDCYEPLPSSQ